MTALFADSRCDAYTVEFFRIFEHMQFRNRLQGEKSTHALRFPTLQKQRQDTVQLRARTAHLEMHGDSEDHADAVRCCVAAMAKAAVMCRCGQAVWGSMRHHEVQIQYLWL